jgi:hypothetical protein
MTIATIETAIGDFRKRRLEVYRTDEDQISRDARGAKATAADHVGRWPLELIQNSDDAKADTVLIRITEKAVYVADTGNGLAVKAIKSISGTHLPGSPEGGIGCKGLGFKAVYDITASPRVLTGKNDGVLFDPEKSRALLAERGLHRQTHEVPHQWLPFWISRQYEERSDPVLREMTDYNTVVKLPITNPENVQAAIKELDDLPPHILLAFNHVRHLTVEADQNRYEITVARRSDEGSEWTLTDTRQASPVSWRVRRKTVPPVPDEILERVSPEDQKRARNATTLVAAPLDADGTVAPVSDRPRLYVYYPTNELAPVRLLLHADFFVSSDRKTLTPFDHSPFNEWLADQLAGEVIAFVNDGYNSDHPWANIRLLAPDGKLEKDDVARSLWDRLKKQATHRLRLPNTTGDRTLTPDNARFLGTDVGRSDARNILKIDDRTADLIHPEIESDKEARLVLDKLGCKKLSDDSLLKFINESAPEHADDHDWLWSCWQWVAAWASDKNSYSPEYKERVQRIRGLPILPVDTTNISRKELADRIVTWRGGEQHGHLPDWLAIRFIDDWFRDLIQKPPVADPIAGLLKALRIDAPSDEVLLVRQR